MDQNERDIAILITKMESMEEKVAENTKATQELRNEFSLGKAHCETHCVTLFASKEQVKKWERLFFYFECLIGSAIVVALLSLVIKKGP
jgi:hypothetical protein